MYSLLLFCHVLYLYDLKRISDTSGPRTLTTSSRIAVTGFFRHIHLSRSFCQGPVLPRIAKNRPPATQVPFCDHWHLTRKHICRAPIQPPPLHMVSQKSHRASIVQARHRKPYTLRIRPGRVSSRHDSAVVRGGETVRPAAQASRSLPISHKLSPCALHTVLLIGTKTYKLVLLSRERFQCTSAQRARSPKL